MLLWKRNTSQQDSIVSYLHDTSQIEIYGSQVHWIPETNQIIYLGGYIHNKSEETEEEDKTTSLIVEYQIPFHFKELSSSNVPCVDSICKIDCLDNHFEKFKEKESTKSFLSGYQIIPRISNFSYEHVQSHTQMTCPERMVEVILPVKQKQQQKQQSEQVSTPSVASKKPKRKSVLQRLSQFFKSNFSDRSDSIIKDTTTSSSSSSVQNSDNSTPKDSISIHPISLSSIKTDQQYPFDHSAFFPLTHSYSFVTETDTLHLLNYSRAFHSSVYVPSLQQIFIFGGNIQNSLFQDVWCNDLLSINIISKTIQRFTPIQYTSHKEKKCSWPFARNQSSLHYNNVKNELIIFGGFNGAMNHSRFNDLFTFSLEKYCWNYIHPKLNSQVSIVPQARVGHASCFIPNLQQLFIYGGKNYLQQIMNNFWCFDFSTQTWNAVELQNWTEKGRSGALMQYCTISGNILLYGGRYCTNQMVPPNQIIIIHYYSLNYFTIHLKYNISYEWSELERCFGQVYMFPKFKNFLQEKQLHYSLLIVGGYHPFTNQNTNPCVWDLELPFQTILLQNYCKKIHFETISVNVYLQETNHVLFLNETNLHILQEAILFKINPKLLITYWYGIVNIEEWNAMEMITLYLFCKQFATLQELKQNLFFYILEQRRKEQEKWTTVLLSGNCLEEFSNVTSTIQPYHFDTNLFGMLQQWQPKYISTITATILELFIYFTTTNEQQYIQVFKSVLFANSEYFKAMCSQQFLESNHLIVTLQDFSLCIWKNILNFICGATVLEFSCLQEYIDTCKCAHMLGLDLLFDIVKKELFEKYLCFDTCKELFIFAMEYDLPTLQQHCLQCIRMQYSNEMEFNSFLKQFESTVE